MGYFSNGTEGGAYEENYCDNCLHNANGKPIRFADLEDHNYQEDGRGVSKPEETRGCPVWFAHMTHNYDECNNDNSILHMLIPLDKENCSNEKCLMFVDRRQKPRTTQLELIKGRKANYVHKEPRN